MAGPWEEYAAPATQAGPWDSFKAPEAVPTPADTKQPAPDLAAVNTGGYSSIPPAFMDRLARGSSVDRILGAAVDSFKEGLGAEPVTGISDETRQQMIDIGLIHDPAKGGPGPIHLFNEAAIVPAAKAFETLIRGVNAGLYGAAGSFGQIVEELGGQGDKAKREAINAGNWAMIESGMGRFTRPGPASDHVVGTLPRAEDFKNAATVVGEGADGAKVAEGRMKELWQEKGLHPSEVAHDAQSDAFLRHDLTAKATDLPTENPLLDPLLLEAKEMGRPMDVVQQWLKDPEGTWKSLDDMAVRSRAAEKEVMQKYGAKRVHDLDDHPLTPTEDRFIFGRVGNDITDPASIREIQSQLQPVDSLSEAATEIRYEMRKLPEDPARMTFSDELVVARLQVLFSEVERLGGNLNEVIKDAGGQYAARFADPEDAAFMAQGAAERLRKLFGGSGKAEAGLPALEDFSGRPHSLGAEVTSMPPDISPSVQPLKPPGSLAAAVHAGADKMFDIGKDMQMLVAPMATGTNESMAIAKDFANTMRRNRWEWSRTDADIEKRFTPEQRTRMWNAADEESVARQDVAARKGTLDEQIAKLDAEKQSNPKFDDDAGIDDKFSSALKRATGFSQPGIQDAAHVKWAVENGRPDIAEAIVSRAERNAKDAATRKPGVDKSINPDRHKKVESELKASAEKQAEEARQLRGMMPDEPALEHQGLATLAPEERAAVEALQSRAQVAWARARDLGMVEGEGLPAYTPRMVINASSALSGDKAIPLNGLGLNLRTRTSQMMHRAYMTAEETEAAMKKGMGAEAEIARDIRALPLATGKLEDAIAGRSLIENIKDYGKRTGTEAVVEGEIPAGSDAKWFTLDHPAFKTWRPKLGEVDGKVQALKDAEGHILFEQVPLYVHGDFEGPLRAVLTQRSGETYKAMMELKGKTMSLIMNSPMIHNAVEFGRAFPAMPSRIVKAYFDGNRAKNDVAIMTEAIDNGLVPIGKRFFNQDINSVMEAPDLTPGRSWTSKVLAAVPGLFDEAAGTAVKRAVDKAGNFWHNTLLWDRIADLQMGIYTNMRGDMLAKGVDQQTASRVAAHFANRYAGALPKEAMSDAATKVANMMLFSRTFTIGNLGVMKDMLTGLPKDVMAQIVRDTGEVNPAAAGYAKSMARRKAFSTVMLDIGLLYVGNSVMQSALNVMLGDRTIDQEAHGYATRLKEVMNEATAHPLSLLQPFDLAEKLSATAENEPGKKDRLKIGYAKDGTAIYARNPVGKIGEEFVGYLTGPLDMIRKKQGTIARPMLGVINNDKGFGRKIYDPTAETPAAYANNMWEIVKHFGKAQIPEGQINALSDLVKGDGDPKVNALAAAGPLAGVTFSKGAPGGPAVGEMYHARQQHEYQVNSALPDIRKQIVRGDVAGAQRAMTDLGIAPALQRFYIRTSQNPATRLSPRALQDFYRTATPQQRTRMENLRTPGPLTPDQ